jgi:hypothetical protein
MDTRNKILKIAEAQRLAGPLTLVTGFFDVLRAADARELADIKRRSQTLVAVVLPKPDELLPQRARAELAAALATVDYVLTVTVDELAQIPAGVIVRREDADLDRAAELVRRVTALP